MCMRMCMCMCMYPTFPLCKHPLRAGRKAARTLHTSVLRGDADTTRRRGALSVLPIRRFRRSMSRTLLLALPALAATREVLSFDFGWKHRTGLHTKASADAQPPADPDPGRLPDESKFNYDAADWEEVSLPHDGLIANAPSEKACPDGCSGKSFIPRHVLWYRKHFMIPADWKRDVFWLDFEGAFRNTTVWLNGVRIASHACGYTPFRVRLDNSTAIRLGNSSYNVLAVYVDPDNGDQGGRAHGSGWWYEGGGL